MMERPDLIISIAKQRIIRDSAQLEAEITSEAPGWVHALYRKFRHGAAEAIAALALDTDPGNTEDIRALQNRVKLFESFVETVREVINEGIAYDAEVKESERQELLDTLMQEPDGLRQAVALGIVDMPEDNFG